jgi:hypothetical protein
VNFLAPTKPLPCWLMSNLHSLPMQNELRQDENGREWTSLAKHQSCEAILWRERERERLLTCVDYQCYKSLFDHHISRNKVHSVQGQTTNAHMQRSAQAVGFRDFRTPSCRSYRDTPQKCHFTLGFCMLNFSFEGCPSSICLTYTITSLPIFWTIENCANWRRATPSIIKATRTTQINNVVSNILVVFNP